MSQKNGTVERVSRGLTLPNVTGRGTLLANALLSANFFWRELTQVPPNSRLEVAISFYPVALTDASLNKYYLGHPALINTQVWHHEKIENPHPLFLNYSTCTKYCYDSISTLTEHRGGWGSYCVLISSVRPQWVN